MARRFKQEGWSLLLRLLQQGPQAGATTLAAATAASSTGGGSAAAALLGVGGGPGSELHGSAGLSSSAGAITAAGELPAGSIMQSALRSLEAASNSNSWNAAHHGIVEATAGRQQEEEGPIAPATLQRVQLAVLRCLQGICGNPAAAPAMQGPLIWDACMLAAPFLADQQTLALREAAAKLLVTAAQVDADTVWLVLADLAACGQDLTQLLQGPARGSASAVEGVSSDSGADAAAAAGTVMKALAAAGTGQAGDGATSGSGGQDVGALKLPKVQQLLPGVVAGTSAAGSNGLQRLLRSSEGVSCGKRAAVLLPRVAQMSVAWHARAEQQLVQLRQK